MPWAAARSSHERASAGSGSPASLCEIAAEHQLGLAVAEFGRGAEPALRGRAVLGQIVTAGIYRAERKHCAAMALGGRLRTAPAPRQVGGPPRPFSIISASATWASAGRLGGPRKPGARRFQVGVTPRPSASIRPYMYCASGTPSAARRSHCAACCSSRSTPTPLAKQSPRLNAAIRSPDAAACEPMRDLLGLRHAGAVSTRLARSTCDAVSPASAETRSQRAASSVRRNAGAGQIQ